MQSLLLKNKNKKVWGDAHTLLDVTECGHVTPTWKVPREATGR